MTLPSKDPWHPIADEGQRDAYEFMTMLGCTPKSIERATQPQVYRRCRHQHICLVNAGHLLHPLTLDVCDLGAEGEGDD